MQHKLDNMKAYSKSLSQDNKGTNPAKYETATSPTNGNASLSSRCDCCPYGYHIDLDFVRYCESVASGEYLQQLKELKKNRRKQRKTMEAYLNYHEKRQRSKEDPTIMSPPPAPPPPPDLVSSRDSLHDAVMDFEQVLKKTMDDDYQDKGRKKPNFIGSIDLLNNTSNNNQSLPCTSPNKSPLFSPSSYVSPKFIQAQTASSPLITSILTPRSRSDSLSSLDSQSTVSTVSNFGVQVNLPEKENFVPASQQMADTFASLNSVGLSRPTTPSGSSVNLNADSLKAVREQMAISLSKMKELEEQVKAIPILQVKISVMKEEKRLLMLQLKAKGGNFGNLNEEENTVSHYTARLYDLVERGVVTPTLTRKNRNRFDNLNLRQPNLSDSELLSPPGITKTILKTRTVGTNTQIMKRDVGVGIIKERSHSIGVGDDCVKDDTSLCSNCHVAKRTSSSISSSDIESDSDSTKKNLSPSRLPVCISCKNKENIQLTTQGMNTESSYIEFVRQKLLEFQIHKLKQLKTEPIDQISIDPVTEPSVNLPRENSPVRLHKETSTDLQMNDVASLSYLEKYKKAHRRDRGVSPTKIKSTNFAAQVSPPKIRTRDFGITVNVVEKKVLQPKAVTVDKSCGTGSTSECDRCVAKKTKSVGIGFDRVDHVVCDRCKSTKMICKGVGDHKISDVVCEKCKVTSETVAVGDDSITDSFCNKCDVLQMETVSVGSDDVNSVFCDKCSSVKMVDAAIGDDSIAFDLSRSSSFEGVKLCDKCNTAIQDVAQNMVKKSDPPPVKPKPKQKVNKASPRSKVQLPSTAQTFINLGFRESISTESSTKSSPEKKKATEDASESDSSDSDSSDSMDEASYDGLQGSISRKCDEDFTIQNSQATLLLQSMSLPQQHKKLEMQKGVNAACKVWNDYLCKPVAERDAKKIVTSSKIVQQDWFKISSQKETNALDVEDYLDQLEDFSKELLYTVVNLSDNNGNTAMHYAVSFGNFDVVSLLLDSKVCDISKQNKAGYTCVMLVSLAQLRNETDKDVVRRLLQLGDINVKAAQNGQTALMLAVSHGRLDMVKLLAEAGADLNIQDNDGSTALMCASEHGHIDIVKYLLSQPDIDATLVDNDGSNALGVAMEANHRDIGLLLYAGLSRGSSPYASLRRKGSRRSTPSRRSSTSTPAPPSPARSRSTVSIS